jgi:flavodoxin
MPLFYSIQKGQTESFADHSQQYHEWQLMPAKIYSKQRFIDLRESLYDILQFFISLV